MSIITLTSDFGDKSFHVPMIKGALLRKNTKLNLIDITHNVNPFDIVQGALIIEQVFKDFPEKTIHLVAIHTAYTADRQFIAFQHKNQYFVGPDNGIFSLIFNDQIHTVFKLPEIAPSHFSLKDCYANAVAHILSKRPFDEIGTPIATLNNKITFRPVVTNNRISGTVIFIDQHENVLINISKTLFEQTRNNRAFKIFFKRHQPIEKLNDNYFEVPVGQVLARFGIGDMLEIAINLGKAASLLGIVKDDTVQIDFE